MIGFFFATKHSTDFNLAMEDAGRGLLPSMRRNDYEITGRHGTVDFGNNTYDTRQISVDIAFLDKDLHSLQLLARDIAYWLSGSGLLYFDDEPDKAYQAKVYESVDTEQLIRMKRATVVFECQPFATSINYFQNNYTGVTNFHEMEVNSKGTQSTPCIIIIKNTSTININNIQITRKAVNK